MMPAPVVPTNQKLSRKRVALMVCLILAVVVGVVIGRLVAHRAAAEAPKEQPLPALFEVEGDQVVDSQRHLPTSWIGVDRTPKPPPAPEAPLQQDRPPLFGSKPVGQAGASPQVTIKPLPFVPVQEQRPGQGQQTTPVQHGETKPTPKKDGVTVLGTGNSRRSVFAGAPTPGTEGTTPTPASAHTSTLIKEAVWEKPREEKKVWYMSQGLHGTMQTTVISNLGSGRILIKVTQPLEDKRLQGQTLIPAQADVVADLAGEPKHGQKGLGLHVLQIELPDGSILGNKAKVSDASGAAAVKGEVDNRYPQIAFAALLSIGLSLAPSVAAGNTTHYNPTLEQEIARRAGQSIAETGNKIVQREIDTAPIITLHPGDPVIIYPNENVTLVKGPKLVW